MENLNKMKNLEYLNLALNNIEIIENLEGCESLQKLDLTLNFIGDLISVEKLRVNCHLEHLYLTGNPCGDYEGYREFVIATLPQLRTLDMRDIERSDRIRALQNLDLIRPQIIAQQLEYKKKREMQKKAAEEKSQTALNQPSTTTEEDTKFWEEMSENTPETRIEMAKHSRRSKKGKMVEEHESTMKRKIKLFNKDGQPNNINEAKIPFSFEEDEERNCFILSLEIYKHLDTSLLDVDVHPHYVTVRIKGKVFQITMNQEVHMDQSVVQRSQTTGQLVIIMPKVKGVVKPKPPIKSSSPNLSQQLTTNSTCKRQYLEIGKSDDTMDFSNITHKNRPTKSEHYITRPKIQEKKPSEGFQDNPDVPVLE